VATSVFQEGVNLHLQCRQVHHYGIAWTPGDNEQRVGRLDRLFGRVHMELAQKGSTLLRIQYPYLAGSFDQDQLASFLQKKHLVERDMDACVHTEFDKTVEVAGVAVDWQEYLQKPAESSVSDPYPMRP
jgi:SNF2 family DNA or RNA helicase